LGTSDFVEPRFVDRVVEFRVLEELCSRVVALPIFLYGPEGCGKSRLFREFVARFDGVGVYVDALERTRVDRALFFSPVVSELREFVRVIAGAVSGSVGVYLADRVFDLVSRVGVRRCIEGERVVVVVDDVVRAIGVDQVEWYVKWLYESIRKFVEEFHPRGLVVVATTSEGVSRRLVSRHRHAVVYLLWNLDYDSFYELARELGAPSREVVDRVWEFVGGNPGRLVEIASVFRWDVSSWIELLRGRLFEVFRIVRSEDLVGELLRVIEDPDVFIHEASPRFEKLLSILEEYNLVIYKYCMLLSREYLRPCPELGVGKYYAWQLPAYRVVLEEFAR